MSTAGALFLVMLLSNSAQVKVADTTCEKSITWLEARGESTRGVAAVRQVIRNRSRHNGSSMCKVVKSAGQFSSYKRGMNLSEVKISEDFLTKWEESSKMHVLNNDYKYYFRKDIAPAWARNLRCDRVVGHHRFCKDN